MGQGAGRQQRLPLAQQLFAKSCAVHPSAFARIKDTRRRNARVASSDWARTGVPYAGGGRLKIAKNQMRDTDPKARGAESSASREPSPRLVPPRESNFDHMRTGPVPALDRFSWWLIPATRPSPDRELIAHLGPEPTRFAAELGSSVSEMPRPRVNTSAADDEPAAIDCQNGRKMINETRNFFRQFVRGQSALLNESQERQVFGHRHG